MDMIEYCNWNDVYEEMKEQKVEALAYTWLNAHRIPDECVHNQWMEQSILQIDHGVRVMWAQQNLLSY